VDESAKPRWVKTKRIAVLIATTVSPLVGLVLSHNIENAFVKGAFPFVPGAMMMAFYPTYWTDFWARLTLKILLYIGCNVVGVMLGFGLFLHGMSKVH